MAAKLYSGGGDDVDHSSESASHGSGGAGAPRNWLRTKLYSVINVPVANTNDAMLMRRLSPSHPSPES
jgi:hypothetical protein